jgi:hypothetical protein
VETLRFFSQKDNQTHRAATLGIKRGLSSSDLCTYPFLPEGIRDLSPFANNLAAADTMQTARSDCFTLNTSGYLPFLL